ncbi:DNA glycosylase AlkZ-like family protein [Breznakiella homolactica]|uniref:YcaQ family DNA glycosylase n=1 Tax=Breznakiella homolactica TaxID=2798577 RepID=A0A7T7XNT7_9SPIR|nr:crosslink repair DNA glycosylase YcaQ family protein [Breznakiella homolactica]QQO09652.1 winged helix DNA-binding domain-containing protein [Breznakiella homolactica]
MNKNTETIHASKEEIRRYLLSYQHLAGTGEFPGGPSAFIRRAGCIQFDPLDTVGRNPDLVLQSRFPEYRKGDIDKLLYEDRVLFDVWDKNMAICAVEDWPYFSRFRNHFKPHAEKMKGAIKTITAYLEKNESACSSDFALEDKVPWHYGPQRTAKAALECMCYTGKAVVHHKKGTRRYYALAKNHIPGEFYSMKDPNTSDSAFYQWMVLRRVSSIGLLWNRGSDAWLGPVGFKSEGRSKAFETLAKKGSLIKILAEGISEPLFIAAENLPLLRAAREGAPLPETVRFIAPLDNLIWDRKLIKAIFNFDYTWEVYVPQNKRRYGYYVLPVLCGESFIGRIEMKTDRETDTLAVENFWPEEGVYAPGKHGKALDRGLERFAAYNRCTKITR